MNWLSRHAEAIEAAAAVVTAFVAVAALIGVKIQLDEADWLQRSQSAREAYRAHLALAASTPRYANPSDGCALITSDEAGAYSAFVDHLLYSAEQMLEVSAGWEETFMEQLVPHQDYLCSVHAPTGATEETNRLLRQFSQSNCEAGLPTCLR